MVVGKINNAVEREIAKLDDTAIKVNVDWSLDNLPKGAFESLPESKFTPEDIKIMVAILGLKRSRKKLNQKPKEITYIMPDLGALASESDDKRSIAKHQLIQEQYLIKVDQEFGSDFRKSEIRKEGGKEETIDASDFDDQDFAVLDLINRIIDSTNKKRDKSQKKSTNNIVKEMVIS